MYLGIDIGGTNFKYAISNLDDFEIELFSFPINPKNSRPEILRYVDNIITENNITKVGIGVPGIINQSGVIKVLPNLPDWENFDLRSYFKDKNLPVYYDNDANIAALAELYEGEGKDLENFLYVTLGTGIGAGIIMNRQILRGDTNSTGEIGHTIIDKNADIYDFNPKYRTGIVEEYAGRKQILDLCKAVLSYNPNSSLHRIPTFDVKDIETEAQKGDSAANLVLKITGYNIAIAITNALNLLDLHTVIIGGGISKSKTIIEHIYENIKLRALPHIADDIKIVNAKFTSNTGVIGSLIAAKFLAK